MNINDLMKHVMGAINNAALSPEDTESAIQLAIREYLAAQLTKMAQEFQTHAANLSKRAKAADRAAFCPVCSARSRD